MATENGKAMHLMLHDSAETNDHLYDGRVESRTEAKRRASVASRRSRQRQRHRYRHRKRQSHRKRHRHRYRHRKRQSHRKRHRRRYRHRNRHAGTHTHTHAHICCSGREERCRVSLCNARASPRDEGPDQHADAGEDDEDVEDEVARAVHQPVERRGDPVRLGRGERREERLCVSV